jgi:hypothetical protein
LLSTSTSVLVASGESQLSELQQRVEKRSSALLDQVSPAARETLLSSGDAHFYAKSQPVRYVFENALNFVGLWTGEGADFVATGDTPAEAVDEVVGRVWQREGVIRARFVMK